MKHRAEFCPMFFSFWRGILAESTDVFLRKQNSTKPLCEPISDMQRGIGVWKKWKTSLGFPQPKDRKRKFSTKLYTLSTERMGKECGKNRGKCIFWRNLESLKSGVFWFVGKWRKEQERNSVNRTMKSFTKNKVGIVAKIFMKNGWIFFKRKKGFLKILEN